MIIAKLKNDIIESIAGKREFNKCKASRNRQEQQPLNLLKQNLKQDCLQMKQCKFRETCIVLFVEKDCLFVFSLFYKSPAHFKFFSSFYQKTKASKPHDSLLMGNYWLALNILRVKSS